MSEIRIATIGNVDSSKSTTLSVLCNDILDDGRGKARALIMKHPHEHETGRTSSITNVYKRFPDKVFAFLDLAGHEKYLKTTICGMNGCLIDYSILTIGCDRGVTGTAKEHLILALALRIPFFIILTKIDIAPDKKIVDTLAKIQKIIKSYSRESFIVNSPDEFKISKKKCPIFMISNVSGENVELLKECVFSLPKKPRKDLIEQSFFNILDTYQIKGIGIVVYGIVQGNHFEIGKQYYLGPVGNTYFPVIIKSIHNNFREHIPKLNNDHSGCFSIKFLDKNKHLTRNQIKRGMILTDTPILKWEFDAKVQILQHPTTIKLKYQPVIHCGNIRQTAEIIKMDREFLRLGDIANVRFRFKYHPEFIVKNNKIVFREANCKGVGKIIDIN